MSQGTLYVFNHSPRSELPLLLIEKFDLDIKVVDSSEVGEDFAANFPLKLFPALIGAEGQKVNELVAVCHHLISLVGDEQAKAELLGSTTDEVVQITRWMSMINGDMITAACQLLFANNDRWPYIKKTYDAAAQKMDIIASIMESRLKEYTYIASEHLSVADLWTALAWRSAFKALLGAEWRKNYPAIMRWYSTVTASDYLKKATAEDTLLAESAKYTPPKKEKKEKKEQPKQEKKQEKKAEKKQDEAEEEPAVQEKKPKHPLAALDKASLNLEDWKRKYSNEDTRAVALPWFWEHYKPEEYSLWKVSYKYNDELTLTFMSNNLIGGFFNRLSASVKYMFGCLVVYGENNNNGITGVIMVRGQDFKPAFDVAPDWESYDYVKLDPSSDADKEFVNNMWAWDKPVVVDGESREIADGKVLK